MLFWSNIFISIHILSKRGTSTNYFGWGWRFRGNLVPRFPVIIPPWSKALFGMHVLSKIQNTSKFPNKSYYLCAVLPRKDHLWAFLFSCSRKYICICPKISTLNLKFFLCTDWVPTFKICIFLWVCFSVRSSSCKFVFLQVIFPSVNLPVRLSSFDGKFLYAEDNCLIEDKWRLRLNSAQFQLKFPTGAELGNKKSKLSWKFGMEIGNWNL